MYETPSFLWLPGVAGPKFDIETKEVKAVIIEYESNTPFSFSYEVKQISQHALHRHHHGVALRFVLYALCTY